MSAEDPGQVSITLGVDVQPFQRAITRATMGMRVEREDVDELTAELLADADGHMREHGAAAPFPGPYGRRAVMPGQLLRGCYELDRDTGAVIERAPVVWRAL